MNTEIIPINPPPEPAALKPSAVAFSLDDLDYIARHAAASRISPQVHNDPSGALMLLLRCQAEGIHPGLALSMFHVIEGKPSMRADAMQARFQQEGGSVHWVETTGEKCVATFRHPDYPDPSGFTVNLTLDEFIKSGVASSAKGGLKDNWRKFGRQMLRARAISEGIRAVLPQVVVGIYTPEEVADFDPAPAPRQPFPATVAPPIRHREPTIPAEVKPPEPNGITKADRERSAELIRAAALPLGRDALELARHLIKRAGDTGLDDLGDVDPAALEPKEVRTVAALLVREHPEWVQEEVSDWAEIIKAAKAAEEPREPGSDG